MSKVYSFRLDDENPREAQAREVIVTWVEEGYSLRYVITEALLIYFDRQNEDDRISNLLEQIKKIISELENTTSLEIINEHEMPSLPSSFVFAVKNSAKNGLRD